MTSVQVLTFMWGPHSKGLQSFSSPDNTHTHTHTHTRTHTRSACLGLPYVFELCSNPITTALLGLLPFHLILVLTFLFGDSVFPCFKEIGLTK